jgi:hypothetical protein
MMIVLVLYLGSYHYVPVIAQCFSDDVPVVTPAFPGLALACDSFPDVSEVEPALCDNVTVPVTMPNDSCDEVPVFIFSFLL